MICYLFLFYLYRLVRSTLNGFESCLRRAENNKTIYDVAPLAYAL